MPETLDDAPLRLQLHNLDDPRVETFQLVLDGAKEEQRIEGLPAGRYQALGVELCAALLPSSAPREILIQKGGTARLELEAGSTGCIVLLPETEQGKAWDGPLHVTIRGERTPRGQVVQSVAFGGPPYSLPFQPPGAFVADVTAQELDARARVETTCTAGQAVEARFQLAP